MSAAASTRGLAYDTASRAVPGGYAMFAVGRCQRCPAEREFRLPKGSNNPEAVQKLFRALGWQFDAWNRGRTRCFACVKAAADRARGESPKEETMVKLLRADPQGGAPSPLALPPDKTALTVGDRARVRALLDGVFDADKGFYIEAYSDAKVAAELGLPEKLVRDYRDGAFGPLKAVPELDEVRAEIATLRQRADAAVTEATAIDAAVAALLRRVDDTARRLGVKA